MSSICVFCGSSSGKEIYANAAKALSEEIAARNIDLIYGGAHVGLMGICADAVLEKKGKVVGIIPESLVKKEVAHPGLTELILVKSMHERKETMYRRSDAFIALPGGFGTLDEFCEILTWAQIGTHNKPIGLLNVNKFYDPLIAQFDLGVREGFIRPEHRDYVVVDSTPKGLLDKLRDRTALEEFSKWETP